MKATSTQKYQAKQDDPDPDLHLLNLCAIRLQAQQCYRRNKDWKLQANFNASTVKIKNTPRSSVNNWGASSEITHDECGAHSKDSGRKADNFKSTASWYTKPFPSKWNSVCRRMRVPVFPYPYYPWWQQRHLHWKRHKGSPILPGSQTTGPLKTPHGSTQRRLRPTPRW